MTKKRTSVWIKPSVLRELKIIGVQSGVPIGDVIAGLVELGKNTNSYLDFLDHAANPPSAAPDELTYELLS